MLSAVQPNSHIQKRFLKSSKTRKKTTNNDHRVVPFYVVVAPRRDVFDTCVHMYACHNSGKATSHNFRSVSAVFVSVTTRCRTFGVKTAAQTEEEKF